MNQDELRKKLITLSEKIPIREMSKELYQRKTPLSYATLYQIVNGMKATEKSCFILEKYINDKESEMK